MIDRGALILAPREGSAYRGMFRPTLDGLHLTGKKARAMGKAYTDAIVAGEGALDDLDQAISLCFQATKMGISVEVIVFEVPQDTWDPKKLPILFNPPSEGLHLLGYDIVEGIEPYFSLLTQTVQFPLNEHGLLTQRAEAEQIAKTYNEKDNLEDSVFVTRIWALTPTQPTLKK